MSAEPLPPPVILAEVRIGRAVPYTRPGSRSGIAKLLPFLEDVTFIDDFSGALVAAALFILLIEIAINSLTWRRLPGDATWAR